MYESLGKLFIGLLFVPANILMRGYTISWLWAWFIVPIWGWQPLTIGQSIGMSLVISTLTSTATNRKLADSEKYDALTYLLQVLIGNAVLLLYGYILHQFI